MELPYEPVHVGPSRLGYLVSPLSSPFPSLPAGGHDAGAVVPLETSDAGRLVYKVDPPCRSCPSLSSTSYHLLHYRTIVDYRCPLLNMGVRGLWPVSILWHLKILTPNAYF